MIAGLGSPHPLGSGLPALYQEDDLAQRLLAALDEVLAPVISTLDNFDRYLEPSLAPLDFVEWLA
jgi:phage tail-like protein